MNSKYPDLSNETGRFYRLRERREKALQAIIRQIEDVEQVEQAEDESWRQQLPAPVLLSREGFPARKSVVRWASIALWAFTPPVASYLLTTKLSVWVAVVAMVFAVSVSVMALSFLTSEEAQS